jgi:hypothetical protein
VTITNIGGIVLPPALAIPAFETFTNVMSTAAATSSGGTISQMFRGTIAYTSGPGGTGINYLTATFQPGATLTGLAGGGSASLIASDPPTTNVVYTSSDPRVLAALASLGANPLENFSISFSGIAQPPGFSIAGGTIASFTAQNSGTFSATSVVPEPSGIVMAGTAMLAGLGCFSWRRRQPKQA